MALHVPSGSTKPAAAQEHPVREKGADCPNCGASDVRRYCAHCGQAAPSAADYSLRAQVKDLYEHLTNLDGKTPRTVWTLLARPGVLTADHLAGRRRRYIRPVQLFLLVNVLLFFAAPRMPLFSYSMDNYSQHAPPSPGLVRSLVARATSAANDAGRAEYVRAFDERVETQRKSLILLFAPGIALVLRLVFRRRQYGEHLVFALHVLAFVWLVVVGWGAVAAALEGKALHGIAAIATLSGLSLLLLAIPTYLFSATRRVYALSRVQALALTITLSAAFVGLLAAYRALLFFTTYYTL
jgi:hypothetical protein